MTIMAFMLVVIINGNTLDGEGWYFKNIYRCNQFAHAVEHGNISYYDKRARQHNISAYCVTISVPISTQFWD